MDSETPAASKNIPHEVIADCAYLIWISEGRPEGRDKQHWAHAEAHLTAVAIQEGKLPERQSAFVQS